MNGGDAVCASRVIAGNAATNAAALSTPVMFPAVSTNKRALAAATAAFSVLAVSDRLVLGEAKPAAHTDPGEPHFVPRIHREMIIVDLDRGTGEAQRLCNQVLPQ